MFGHVRTPRDGRPLFRSLRLSSVGAKLAAVIVVVLTICATGAYIGLSRHERESLLSAKESSATMVARLFTANVAAAVAFADDKAAQDNVGLLAENPDVIFGAVWALDPNDKTRVAEKLGHLEKDVSFDRPEVVPSTLRVQRSADWVLIEAPVYDPDRNVVGVTQVVLSLARENAAIAKIKGRTLLGSGGVALALTAILLLLSRMIIVRPLARLTNAARRLEAGEPVTLEVTGTDEIATLAGAVKKMSVAIANREAQISERNRDMRLVLDNVEDGFIAVALDGTMSEERSRIFDEWFGPPAANASFIEYATQIDATVGAAMSMAWEALREAMLPVELLVDQMPRALERDGRSFELSYRPILDGDSVRSMVVVVRNVTARIERERAEREQHELLGIFRHVLADRVRFEEFLAEASGFVRSIRNASDDGIDDVTLRRHIHTLKGNCSMFGIESVTQYCHDLEQRMLEHDSRPTEHDVAQLESLWEGIVMLSARLTEGPETRRIELDEQEYADFVAAVRSKTDHRKLLPVVTSWRHDPASHRLAGIADQLTAVAERLGKSPLELEIAPTKLRLPHDRWAPVWAVFSHVVRNTVDHGLETRAERAERGKCGRAKVALRFEEGTDEVALVISDNGAGIAWEKLRVKAAALGLPHETKADLEEAMYADSVSSCDVANENSGRGVGMGAIRAAVRSCGGRIVLASTEGEGSTFRFTFPRTMLEDPATVRPISLAPANVNAA